MTPIRHRFRLLAAVLSVFAVVLVGALAVTPPKAEAATASDFQPGYIISDANFYNGGAVDAGNIQAWLNIQVTKCDAGYTCLKDYRESTYSRSADAMCAAYTGVANETAATIIAKVGAACGISQRVILVLLQKEQSLVTDTSPTTGQYQKATGFACPDTGGCDTTTLGFYNQVYKAAWQFKRYSNPPGTSPYFSWLPIGQVSAIRYSPTASCGSSNVLIRNQATAALYYYTPYQPNAAALANLYGTGDGCSAYGNRNFWRLYSDWFGSPTVGARPTGNFEAAQLTASTFAVSGWTFDPSLSSVPLTVQITWNTPSGVSSQSVVANLSRSDVGNAYPMAGPAHGFSASVPRTTDGQYSACLVAIAAPGNPSGNSELGCRTVLYSSTIGGSPASSRISGSDRFDTSVAVSQAAYPTAGVPVVYIASGMNFADALSAGPAAAAQKGPLLLSTGADMTASVLAEVKRLAPAKIVVVGGVNAVSAAAVAKLAALQPNIQRIAGSDRFETSRLVAQYAFPGAKGAYFASGLNFPDALSAAAAAGAGSQPVVLVTGFTTTDAGTSAYAASAKLTAATVVGGTTAISPALDTSLRATGATVTRIGGSDRFETSHLVNSQKFPTAPTVYIASGVGFPDALAGSAVAGAQKAPLFVAQSYCVPRSIGNDLVSMRTTKVVFIGGTAALSADAATFRAC